MTLPNEQPLNKLQFYVTTGYPCGYLPKQLAQSLIASPQRLVNSQVYSQLIQQGFRRSGHYAYRPHCENCNACTPIRINIEDFKPSRSQKRAYKQHSNLTVQILPVDYKTEHYKLYQQYQLARHSQPISADEKVSPDSIDQYRDFLCSSGVESVMVEFRDDNQLKMVSVIDLVEDGISAVYTFYAPNDPKTSYGTFNILWQLDWAKQLKLNFLYLGYWIADCQKMHYKSRFQPQEHWQNGEWKLQTNHK